MYDVQFKDELLGHDWLELYATEILDVKYQWKDVKDMVAKHQHQKDKQRLTY